MAMGAGELYRTTGPAFNANPFTPITAGNVTHQDNTLFAALFTCDAQGKGLWLVMPAGLRQGDGSFQGERYRTTGPAFNAQPFTPIGPDSVSLVGTARFTFADGNNATLVYTCDGTSVTKSITRQAFASPTPSCS
jgi:hypothetical protein